MSNYYKEKIITYIKNNKNEEHRFSYGKDHSTDRYIVMVDKKDYWLPLPGEISDEFAKQIDELISKDFYGHEIIKKLTREIKLSEI